MTSKIGSKYKLKGTETHADILGKIGGSGGGARVAKTQGQDYKRMKKAEVKDARTAKRMDKEGTKAHNKRVTAARKKVEMKVTKAKKPVTTAKKAAIVAVAAAAGNVSGPAGKSVKVKKTTKPVRWRNSKRVGRTKVVSKLRTEYNPKTDQWIKYTD